MATSTTNHWKLGLFVLSGLFLAIATLGWWLNRKLEERKTFTSHYFFDEPVDGLNVGSDIRFRGVPIGRVADIKVASDARYVHVIGSVFVDALNDLGLDADQRPKSPAEGPWVDPELRVQLNSNLLTGQTFIQGDFFDLESHPIPDYPFEVPWETVHSVPSAFYRLTDSLDLLVTDVSDVLASVRTLVSRIDTAVVDLAPDKLGSDLGHLVQTLDETLTNLEDLEILKRGSETLGTANATLESTRALVEDFRNAEGPLVRVLNRYEKLGGEVQQELPITLKEARELMAGLTAAANEFTILGRHLDQDLGIFRKTLQSIERLADQLERDPGSLIHGKTLGESP